MNKRDRMISLIERISQDITPTINYKLRNSKKVNIGYVNQFSLHNEIPNKWFDWAERVNAEIMIIGQDWGPYSVLKKYIEEYNTRKNDKDFNLDKYYTETFSSRTEKFIISSLKKSYYEKYNKEIDMDVFNNIFFTVAIMFTRQGNHFRGNEFYDEKFGIKVSYIYLKEQIDIVKPKIIIPLGNTAWSMIRDIFKLYDYDLKISNVINNLGKNNIIIGDTIIIPNYHPAAHINPNIQYDIWKKIWV